MGDGSRMRSDARCPQNAPCTDMTAYAFRRHGAYVCHRIDGENQDYQSAVYADCHGFRDYFGVCSPFGICPDARRIKRGYAPDARFGFGEDVAVVQPYGEVLQPSAVCEKRKCVVTYINGVVEANPVGYTVGGKSCCDGYVCVLTAVVDARLSQRYRVAAFVGRIAVCDKQSLSGCFGDAYICRFAKKRKQLGAALYERCGEKLIVFAVSALCEQFMQNLCTCVEGFLQLFKR